MIRSCLLSAVNRVVNYAITTLAQHGGPPRAGSFMPNPRRPLMERKGLSSAPA